MKKLKNVGASVRTRLLEHAKTRNDDFQLVLVRYVNERLLFRLGASAHAKNFVLKGAALFTAWTGRPHRATRDLDFLAPAQLSAQRLREVFLEILALPVEDDGVTFDLRSLEIGPIRRDQKYGGLRATLTGRVAVAQVRIQVDVGFGDSVTPPARMIDFPALLDFPAPRLRAYSRETVVAEKVHTMVEHDLANTRMKDFFDLRLLSELFEFDGALVVKALRATFARRGTPIPTRTPPGLTAAFFEDGAKVRQWTGFLKKSSARDAGDLEATVQSVRRFCELPLQAAGRSGEWAASWEPPGPWRKRGPSDD